VPHAGGCPEHHSYHWSGGWRPGHLAACSPAQDQAWCLVGPRAAGGSLPQLPKARLTGKAPGGLKPKTQHHLEPGLAFRGSPTTRCLRRSACALQNVLELSDSQGRRAQTQRY